MNSRWQILKTFIQKEIRQVLRDKRMRLVLFVAPLVLLTLFGVAISTETRNIKLAMYTNTNDVLLSDLYNRALGTEWFVPARVTGNDPFEWVQSAQADAVLVPPKYGVGRGIQIGDAKIQLLINAQNSVRAQAIEFYLKTIANTVYTSELNRKLPHLKFVIRALYNPTMETSMYMVPGVLSMLVCLVTILLTSMSVAREKEVGTIETLTAAPIDSLDLLLGKTVPFILLGCIQAIIILLFAVYAFDLPIRGSIALLIISTLLMIMATVSIGILISTISRNQQQAMLGGFMFLFPAYLLSGLMFPIENMPIYIKPLAYINPLTHYMGLIRNILLIGGDLNYFLIHGSILFVITLIITIFAFRRFKSLIM